MTTVYTATSAQKLLRTIDQSLHTAPAGCLTVTALESYLLQVEEACRAGFRYVSGTSDDAANRRIMLETLRLDLWERIERAEEAAHESNGAAA